MNDKEIKENEILFTNYVVGYKGIPYNSTILLKNNASEKNLSLFFQIDKQNYVINVPFKDIKNISYTSRTATNNIQKGIEDNESKSSLLSMALFAGNPVMMVASSSLINSFLDTNSSNYNKVSYNIEYEIEIDFILNNEEKNLVLNTKASPEEFINQLKEDLKEV